MLVEINKITIVWMGWMTNKINKNNVQNVIAQGTLTKYPNQSSKQIILIESN